VAAPSTLLRPAAIAAASRHLEDFAQSNDGVKLAVLTSSDGFEIAAVPATASSAARIAAMSSSIQALSQALAQEAGLAASRNLIIETDTGTVLLLGVEPSSSGIVLAVVATGKELLGKLLWASSSSHSAGRGIAGSNISVQLNLPTGERRWQR